MKLFFNDPMFEQQAFGALGHTLYGGADFGECFVTAQRITEGDTESWYREWLATAERVGQIAEDCRAKGHLVSAREAYLRAANYYRTSYLFLFGAPTAARLVAAFDREVASFLQAAALFDPPVEPIEIPFEGTTLPGYFYRVDDSGQARPTLIATNGYDSTVQQMHFGHAVAAVRRGYNCLTFDGPGQGRVLYRQGLPLRHDWENVVSRVVDFALTKPEVDPQKLALVGWSFGGYLAPRAASGEQRLAACIADPGQWDMLEGMKAIFATLPAAAFAAPRGVDQALFHPYLEKIEANFSLHWKFVQRGFWVHGVNSLAEYLEQARNYSLSAVAERITCPTLVTQAESDPVAGYADKLYQSLRCPKQLIRFTKAEGAGDHCEAMARALFHQRSFDWLDEVLDVERLKK